MLQNFKYLHNADNMPPAQMKLVKRPLHGGRSKVPVLKLPDCHCERTCFWLSVVAAWSQITPKEYEDDQLQDLQRKVLQFSLRPVSSFRRENRIAGGSDDLGKLADELRN